MRMNGARALIANSRSQSSTLVSSSVPRGAEAGGVHKAVHAVAGAHDVATRFRVGEVGGDERRVELGGDRLAPLAVPAGDHELRAQGSGPAGDRRAQALGRAGHDDPAAVEPLVGELCGHSFTGRPSRSDSHAARPITSGARASMAPTGGGVPLATAPMKASHSRR